MTDTPKRRKTTDELLAEAEERTRQLKARKRRETARKREAAKAQERKRRARCLIEMGAALLSWLRKSDARDGFVNALSKHMTTNERREETIMWIREQLGGAAPQGAEGTPPPPQGAGGGTSPQTS